MTTAKVDLTEGSGKSVATYSVSEDAATKQIQRVALNDSAGAEIAALVNDSTHPMYTRYTLAAAELTATNVSFSSSGDNTIKTRSTGTLKMHKLILVAKYATDIIIKNGAGTSLIGPISLTDNQPLVLPFDSEPWATTTSTNDLIVNSSVAVAVGGAVWTKES